MVSLSLFLNSSILLYFQHTEMKCRKRLWHSDGLLMVNFVQRTSQKRRSSQQHSVIYFPAVLDNHKVVYAVQRHFRPRGSCRHTSALHMTGVFGQPNLGLVAAWQVMASGRQTIITASVVGKSELSDRISAASRTMEVSPGLERFRVEALCM